MIGSLGRKNAVITGGNRGIGFEVVRELYLRGYNVIIGSRTITKNEESIAKITKQKQQSSLKTQQPSLIAFSLQNTQPQILKSYHLDLSSMQSIKLFTQFINKNFQHIDILINNAAILPYKLQISQQLKVQKSLVTNYFGHFQLTSLLFPLLIKSQNHGKIINVTCSQYQFFEQRTVFDDFDCQIYPFQANKQYIIAKMMLLAMVLKLNECIELRQLSDKVKIFAVEPGDTMTQLGNTSGAKNLYKSICCCCYQKPQEAARSIIYLATENIVKLQSGALYGSNTDIISIDHRVSKAQFCEKSWTLTQEILKTKFDFSN